MTIEQIPHDIGMHGGEAKTDSPRDERSITVAGQTLRLTCECPWVHSWAGTTYPDAAQARQIFNQERLCGHCGTPMEVRDE